MTKIKTINEIKKGCGNLIYKSDTIRCGEWSGGDKHYCKKCFNKLSGENKK